MLRYFLKPRDNYSMKSKLSPGHEIVSNEDESVPLFGHKLLDMFSRVYWFVPLLIFLPVIAYFSYTALVLTEISILNFIFYVILGFFLWTIAEYLVHRFVFHHYPKNKLGQKIHFIMHGVHHAYPNDSLRLLMPPILSIPLATFFYFIWLLIFGKIASAIFVGFIFGYLCYDMMHYATHHAKFMKAPWFLRIKNHHMQHHFKDPDHGFGVSSDFWDKIFKTEIK